MVGEGKYMSYKLYNLTRKINKPLQDCDIFEATLWAESPEKALSLLHRAEASTRGLEFKVEENGNWERLLMVRSYEEYKGGQEGWK